MAHRRAYWPRWWPVALPTGVAVAALCLALNPTPPLSFAIGGVAGWLAMHVRLRIWKHRHPVISVQELTDDRRRVAMWN